MVLARTLSVKRMSWLAVAISKGARFIISRCTVSLSASSMNQRLDQLTSDGFSISSGGKYLSGTRVEKVCKPPLSFLET